jgi:hypothetical protein
MMNSKKRRGRKFSNWVFSDGLEHIQTQIYLDRRGVFSAEIHGKIVEKKSYEDLDLELRRVYLAARAYEWSPKIAVCVSAGQPSATWHSKDAGETVAIAVRAIWLAESAHKGDPVYIEVDPDGGEIVALDDFYSGNPLEIAQKYHADKDEVLIPWSEERWLALLNIQVKVRELRERLSELVSSPDRIDALSGGSVGLLGPHSSE